MALIKCTECGKEISSLADFCPNCGCPSSEFATKSDNQGEIVVVTEEVVSDSDNDEMVENQKENSEETETEIETKKSKTPFIALTLIVIVIAIIVVGFVVIPYSNASEHYKNGIGYLESNQYYNAYKQFQVAINCVSSNYTSDYKDSKSLSVTCVQKLIDEKDYELAFKCITDNEDIAKHITVKEDDYAELGDFIDKRLINAFSKDKNSAHNDIKACYAIAANNVLPNNYGNVKAYINIGIYTATSHAEYGDDEDFFISVSSALCDLLENNSELDIIKRILEQDSLIEHFLSGETADRRHEDYGGECISTWNDINSDRQFFIHGIGNGGCSRIGSWEDYDNVDNGSYYTIKNATYYIGFDDKTKEEIPQFTITINSYNNITVASCSTNEEMTMTRRDFQNLW
mgnify:FL=1